MKKNYLLVFALLFSIFSWAQPANDDACSPFMLTIGDDCTATLPYDNTGATAQIGESVGDCYGDGSIEQTVWFSFVAPNTGAVSINTDFAGSGMQDSQLAVYELQGGDCTVLPNFVQIACNEDRIPTVNTAFNAGLPPIPLNPGQTYYIQVDGFFDTIGGTDEGSFCIVVTEETPPANDDCDSPDVYGGFGPSCTKVWGDDASENTTTIGATAGNGLDILSCDGTGINASVYYTFSAGVAEVEFNLISGENINVALFTNPGTGCGSSVEVTGNCFTDVNASPMEDPNNPMPEILFTNLTPQTAYLMAIWTDEGEATDFEFCLTRAPTYSCGDGVCYELAESYTDCSSDCPCLSSIDLYSYITGAVTAIPEAVCPEIAGGLTDPANPGLYIPFTINTDDPDLPGSIVSSDVGTLFTSTTPPSPLPNSEATNFLIYLFLTEAELAAGGNVTITFTSDTGACTASITFAIADLIRPDTSECGGCDLNIVPDYANAFCDGTSVSLTLAVENAIGPNVWISQDGNTWPDDIDLLIALDGSTSINFPTSDLTLTVYDDGNPNCAVSITFTTGDFTCSVDPACIEPDGSIATTCRLEPVVSTATVTCNPDRTLAVPIDVGAPTGVVTFSPDIVNGSGTIADPYTVSVDLNNCQPIDFTIADESTCDVTPSVTVNSPESIAGGIIVSTNADDWGVQIATDLGVCGSGGAVTGPVAVVNDGDTAGGQLTDFCEPTPPTVPDANVCAQVAGQIVLIDRGQCNFTQKVENAQNCGAIGVVICNCQPGPGWCAADDDVLITMAAGTIVNPITIPAVFMLYSDCQEIKTELNNGNDVEICIGASENIVGCERDFTLDVCNDFPADFCQNMGIPGCTDQCADNYDPNADSDDGSCNPYDMTCNDDCILGPFGGSWDANTCACINETAPVIGCTDPSADNYDPSANCDEGCITMCEEEISGSVTAPDGNCDLSGINIIITAPDGTTATVVTGADGSFTLANGPFPCGTYTAEFEDTSILPDCYTDTGSIAPINFDLDGDPNTDDGPTFAASPTIPTLSQWGLMVLALLLMTFGALKLSFNPGQIIYNKK